MSAGSLRRTRTMVEGNGTQSACSRRRNCTLAEGNRAGHAGSLRRNCAVRICNRRRRNPWARNRGNLAALLGRLATCTRVSCETNGGAPDSAVGGQAGCVVPPSSCHLPVRKVPGWHAFGFPIGVVGIPKAHSRSINGSRRSGRGCDTTVVARRVWVTRVTVVTVYLALFLVVPSRLTWTMATRFLMVVRARRFAVAAVTSHACLPSSVSVIVTKLAEFRVQTASRINDWVPVISERVGVFGTVEAMPPVFSEDSGAGGGREKAAPKRRVVGLERGTNGENLCVMFL